MQQTFTLERLSEARGQTVYSSDGEKIGSVDEIYYDYETNQPEWVSVGTGLLGTKRRLVPVEGADLRDDGLYVQYTKDQVKDAPDAEGDEIDQESERALYSHYGLGYSERRSESGLPEGGAPATEGVATEAGAPATEGVAAGGGAPTAEPTGREGEVVRHEEELAVGTRPTEAGRARLRKWVETEPVSEEVTVERERARVEREPVDRPASAGEIGEQEVEVPLRGEEPVVEKETVARERVGVEKDVERERETVGGEVRKERVDVEGDAEGR